jgi:hypothetical protein
MPLHVHELNNTQFLLDDLKERRSSFIVRCGVADRTLRLAFGIVLVLYVKCLLVLGCKVWNHDEAGQRHRWKGWSHLRTVGTW